MPDLGHLFAHGIQFRADVFRLYVQLAEWYRKSPNDGYEPDGEDRKHLEDVPGKQMN